METSTARVALKWGLLTALVGILLKSIQYAQEAYTSPAYSMLGIAVSVGGLVLAMREFRTQNGGYMTYGEGLGLGVLMFALIGLLDTTYVMVYQTVIDPDMNAKVLEQAREQLEKAKLPDSLAEKMDEAMEEAADKKQKGVSGLTFIAGIFGQIFWGFILSLIVSGFMSRKKTNPFD
ncbi:MAG: DUF4199 domain-containing protein [Rudanella sp.]|nr:DUF4199 domain-containing protein [Rudanella sp.]